MRRNQEGRREDSRGNPVRIRNSTRYCDAYTKCPAQKVTEAFGLGKASRYRAKSGDRPIAHIDIIFRVDTISCEWFIEVLLITL